MALTLFFLINCLEAFLLAYFLYDQGSISSLVPGTTLSASRLVLVSLMVLIGVAFLVLGIRAIKKSGFWVKSLADFIHRDRSVFIIIFTCLLILAGLLIALSAPPLENKNQQIVFLRLEPILAWLTVVITQALFYIICFFITTAVLKNPDEPAALADMNLPALIFLGLVLVKLLVVTATAYGPAVGDELEYYDIAFYLNQGNLFYLEEPFHYPLLYGVSLLPAMAFGQHTFTAIKFLNVILSSSTVFPIYFLARFFINRKKAAAVVLLCCLLPFHLVFPRRIQSENLYYPLFFWSVLFIFNKPRDSRHELPWDILSGLGLGVLFLTRYITLAALPAFFLGWWQKTIFGKTEPVSAILQGIQRFILVAGCALLAFSPWLFMGFSQGVPLRELVGFGIAANVGDGSHLNFQNLLIWAVLYACYYIFMASPILPLFITSAFSGLRRGADPIIRRWIIFVGLLAAAYGAAVVRHSWRAYYNARVISKIMGRYVTFLAPLFILTAFIAFLDNTREKPVSLGAALAKSVLAFALIIFSYLVFMANVIFPTDGTLLKALGSIDGYYVQLLGSAFLVIIGVIYLIITLAQIRRCRSAWLVTTVLVAVYSLIALPPYYHELVQEQVYARGGQQIAEAIIADIGPENLSKEVNLHLPDSNQSSNNNKIAMSVSVRGFMAFYPTTYTVVDVQEIQSLDGYVLLPQDLIKSTDGLLMKTLEINSEQFALVKKR